MCAACVRASLVHGVRKAAAKTRGILVTDDILSDVYKKTSWTRSGRFSHLLCNCGLTPCTAERDFATHTSVVFGRPDNSERRVIVHHCDRRCRRA